MWRTTFQAGDRQSELLRRVVVTRARTGVCLRDHITWGSEVRSGRAFVAATAIAAPLADHVTHEPVSCIR